MDAEIECIISGPFFSWYTCFETILGIIHRNNRYLLFLWDNCTFLNKLLRFYCDIRAHKSTNYKSKIDNLFMKYQRIIDRA